MTETSGPPRPSARVRMSPPVPSPPGSSMSPLGERGAVPFISPADQGSGRECRTWSEAEHARGRSSVEDGAHPPDHTEAAMKKGLSQIILGGQSLIADGLKLCQETGYTGLEI